MIYVAIMMMAISSAILLTQPPTTGRITTMARDTDRKKISEAVRLTRGHAKIDWVSRNTAMIMTKDVKAGVLQVSYSANGRITDLFHAGATGKASAHVINRKRAHVLDFLGVTEEAVS
ncbi:hypothetical protein SEA_SCOOBYDOOBYDOO_16 [Mycobacterium phage ScoobyDoobyDoo]|nr:hypothetical protein SEA_SCOOBYDOOBYDOO_16 [Mycobacterium phage ScoobyDoobyDoo]